MEGFFENLKPKKGQEGTSLIELLLYFSLLTIILIIAVDLMIRTSEFSLEAAGQNVLQEDARFIGNRLAYDIHQASSIVTPATLGQTTSTLTISVGAETHTYTLAGNNLQYQKTVGTNTQTANLNSNLTKINSLSFQRLGNTNGKHTIKITFEIEDLKGKKGGPTKKTFESVVGLR
jgi:hypothetical protein